ncbi:MAG: hypothetical protein Q8922_07030 [Bacteroidota bacterium]|nr:hypothetical protein [Bacteroidota bacterium]MDP4234022.1 hypothetical protein [Bacteroidota bacterium]MDP4242888.1 hypothetical protein [Bacteroidota bacterium]MDP4287673.1 hypothetical protein [Bacteroidota bacterium]
MRSKISCVVVSLFLVPTVSPVHAQQIARQLSNVVALVKGEVTSTDGSHPGGVSLTFLKGTERVTTTKTKTDGKFSMVLTPGAMYRIVCNDPEYLYHEDTLVIPQLTAYKEFPVATVLTPLRNGQRFDLSSPLFLPKSTALEPRGAAEMEKIVEELKHNTKLSLAITVYPDKPVMSKKDAMQEKIAIARAANLRAWMLGKNIPSTRYEVTTVTTSVPAGRFDLGPGYATSDEPKGKKKKKAAAPKAPSLVPQFVEITAHLAQ